LQINLIGTPFFSFSFSFYFYFSIYFLSFLFSSKKNLFIFFSVSQVKEILLKNQQDLDDRLKRVQELHEERQRKLDEAYNLQKFINESNDADSWLQGKIKDVQSIEDPKDIRSAEAALRKLDKIEAASDAYKEVLFFFFFFLSPFSFPFFVPFVSIIINNK